MDALLIDGNNLLHRTAGSTGPAQVRELLARLRLALPEHVSAVLMLDGHPAPGEGRRLVIARNLEIRHSGSRSADDALVELAASVPPAQRAGVTLVSDDNALSYRVRMIGARTRPLAWLEALLAGGGRGAGGGSIGSGRRPPPRTGGGAAGATANADGEGASDGDERPVWRPGRGATRKVGNPRRAPKRRRPAD